MSESFGPTDKEQIRVIKNLVKGERTKRELRGLVKTLSNEVDELERDLNVALGIKKRKVTKIKIPKSRRGRKSQVCPLILWSDLHIEEYVYPYQTNGRNTYNPEIARARFDRLVPNNVKLIKREEEHSIVSEAILWLGGDFMTGHIHPDMVEITATSPTETSFMVYQWLCEGIDYILEELSVDRLYIPTSFGNHGRIHQGKPRVATAGSHNIEQLVYWLLDLKYEEDDRVVFDTSNTKLKYIDLGGFMLRFGHGDEPGWRFSGGVGGLTIPFNKAVSKLNNETKADLDIRGHYHVKIDLEYALFNGSMIGTSEYSRFFGYEPPQQVLAFIDRERNRKAGVFPIFVD